MKNKKKRCDVKHISDVNCRAIGVQNTITAHLAALLFLSIPISRTCCTGEAFVGLFRILAPFDPLKWFVLLSPLAPLLSLPKIKWWMEFMFNWQADNEHVIKFMSVGTNVLKHRENNAYTRAYIHPSIHT